MLSSKKKSILYTTGSHERPKTRNFKKYTATGFYMELEVVFAIIQQIISKTCFVL
jgi:hypothetical protein